MPKASSQAHQPDDRALEPGIQVAVHIERDVLTVLRATRVRHASRAQVRPPALTPDRQQAYERKTAEIVCAVLDGNGSPLDAFAWGDRATAFFDSGGALDQEYGDIHGGRRNPGFDVRIWRFPLSDRAHFLFFFRSELVDESGRGPWGFTTRQQPLALYFLQGPPEPPPFPPLPIPWPDPPAPLPIPWKPEWPQFKPPPIVPPRIHPFRASCGQIASTQTLVNNGASGVRFDVVLLGDGFTAAEMPAFDAHVTTIVNGLLSTPPFDALAPLMNIHVVRAESCDSGVENCPNPSTARRTFFNVEGDWLGAAGPPGYFGTSMPTLIWDAAEVVVPWDTLELMIVIVNCNVWGGSAWPDLRIAFVPAFSPAAGDTRRLHNLAMHEAAHVIARVTDEYLGCEAPNPLEIYANQATHAQRLADTVSWKPLAVPAELNAGMFRAIHQIGDAFDANNDPIVPVAVQGMLGLFWGCLNVDPALPVVPGVTCGTDPAGTYQDPRGRDFYRPMANCKMRKTGRPFCRVCAGKLTESITAATV